VWIRSRPFEIIWRTTHSFSVDDIRLIEIRPVVRERWRRRVVMGQARTRLSEAVLTRLTLQDENQEVAIELHETPAAIAEVFADLAHRLAAAGGWHEYTSAGVRRQHAPEEPAPIGANPAPGSETDTDLQRELFSSPDRADPAASEPVGDDLFSETSPKVEWWRLTFDDTPDAARSPAKSAGDQQLFPYEEPTVASGHGVWIRKRTSRTRRVFR
jgi:hypothetical protein